MKRKLTVLIAALVVITSIMSFSVAAQDFTNGTPRGNQWGTWFDLQVKGNSNRQVNLLQTVANESMDGPTSPLVIVDGKFGQETYEQVRRFQTFSGISVDGKVGKNTWNKMSDYLRYYDSPYDQNGNRYNRYYINFHAYYYHSRYDGSWSLGDLNSFLNVK